MSEHVEDLLGLYSLGGLEEEARARVEAHLATCAACRRAADEYQALAALVGQSVQPVEPPPAARARLMARLADRGRRRPTLLGGARLGLRWAAALSAVSLIALAAWNLSLSSQLTSLRQDLAAQQQTIASLQQQADVQQRIVGVVTSPNTTAVELAGQGTGQAAFGRAYVDQDAEYVALIVWHLPPVGPGQTYQAWLITPDGPQPSGLFTVNANGWGMTAWEVSAAHKNFNAIGVSLEPTGGSAQPTNVVLAGGL